MHTGKRAPDEASGFVSWKQTEQGAGFIKMTVYINAASRHQISIAVRVLKEITVNRFWLRHGCRVPNFFERALSLFDKCVNGHQRNYWWGEQ